MLMKVQTTDAPAKRQRVQDTCRCNAYRFPHRAGSGKCQATDPGPFCGHCGQPCEVRVVDHGIGAYEYWGGKGTDTRIEAESDCCGAGVFADAELKINYTGEEY